VAAVTSSKWMLHTGSGWEERPPGLIVKHFRCTVHMNTLYASFIKATSCCIACWNGTSILSGSASFTDTKINTDTCTFFSFVFAFKYSHFTWYCLKRREALLLHGHLMFYCHCRYSLFSATEGNQRLRVIFSGQK